MAGRRPKSRVVEDSGGSLKPQVNSPSRKADPTRASADLVAFRQKHGKSLSESMEDEAQLPKWVMHVLARKMFCDMTWSDAVREEFKTEQQQMRKRRALDHYRKSPAFQKLVARMKSDDMDIRQMAADVIAGHAMKIGYLNLKVLKLAEEARNIPELAKQSRWLAENYGMTVPKKTENQAPTNIVIQFSGGQVSAEIPMGESESVKVLPAEIVKDE